MKSFITLGSGATAMQRMMRPDLHSSNGSKPCDHCRVDRESGYLHIQGHKAHCNSFVWSFLDALYSRINTMCSCRVDSNETSSKNDRQPYSKPCYWCRVDIDMYTYIVHT